MNTIARELTGTEYMDLVNSNALAFANHGEDYSISEQDFQDIVKKISESVIARDYLIGLQTLISLDESISFVEWMMLNARESEGPESTDPLCAVLSLLYYEAGNIDKCLMMATACDQNYSLANLVKRIAFAGWPSDHVATMLQYLHAKVTRELTNEKVAR